MKRSEVHPLPQFFDRYIGLVDDIDLVSALRHYAGFAPADLQDQLGQMADLRYAPEKWTIRDIIQHVIDNERVQTYRALRFARGDSTPLPGYDEQLFAAHTAANQRGLGDLLSEFECVRSSSIALFGSFDEAMMRRSGPCFGLQISVAAIGFALVGHQIHHLNVIRERYIPMLPGK